MKDALEDLIIGLIRLSIVLAPWFLTVGGALFGNNEKSTNTGPKAQTKADKSSKVYKKGYKDGYKDGFDDGEIFY